MDFTEQEKTLLTQSGWYARDFIAYKSDIRISKAYGYFTVYDSDGYVDDSHFLSLLGAMEWAQEFVDDLERV